ncbi:MULTISPECIES: hypothetical protein [Rhodomicrobium]|uniref:hypothetical protein n=1 Tax=Rhodomicrobium TaxID=1068 RepID=UPI000B4AAFA6|nr:MULTISPECIES: hypothetical protein [Rhodomicrobium]
MTAAPKGPGRPTALRALLAAAAFVLLLAGAAGLARVLQFAYATPTVSEYLEHLGGAGTVVPAGELTYDGHNFRCGRFPTVLNAKLNDYGAAYFGFVLLNPDRFATMSPMVKRYAYAHECGHQYVGYDEGEADCYAIRRGRREGWLDRAALEEICGFISRSKGDAVHAFGVRRCEMMKLCFARSRPGREPL